MEYGWRLDSAISEGLHFMSESLPHFSSSLVWLRRDLRLTDHRPLYRALKSSDAVYLVFVFDTTLLKNLPLQDRRVEFIWASLAQLRQRVPQLIICEGDPRTLLPSLAQDLGVQAVFVGRDYEPAAIERDALVRGQLAHQGIAFFEAKDQCIFDGEEVRSATGRPYTVFTPYKNAWLKRMHEEHARASFDYSAPQWASKLQQPLTVRASHWLKPLPSLQDLGFEPSNLSQLSLPLGMEGAARLWAEFVPRMSQYGQARDFPALKGPSYLSVHLRFGTMSIRQLVRAAWPRYLDADSGAAVWLSELIWRDFYFQILAHFPHIAPERGGKSFKPAYDAIQWERGAEATAHFAAWCAGQTGYPLVDAAMRQLNQTGYMHNRLRMVAASFLCKHLGLDWRWGEAYFAQHLNDFDLSANNGGWQWAASSGCDAQPYFRIFNPITQSEKFDAEGKFIRRYVPELAALDAKDIHAPWTATRDSLLRANVHLGKNYPLPVVEHTRARQQTLERYQVVKLPK